MIKKHHIIFIPAAVLIVITSQTLEQPRAHQELTEVNQ